MKTDENRRNKNTGLVHVCQNDGGRTENQKYLIALT